jgi:hypothetical protein
MKHLLAWLFVVVVVLSGGAIAAEAHSVEVSHAWIRVLPGDLPAGGYARLRNGGDSAVTLIGAQSPDYSQVMLHKSTTHNGLSKMTLVERLPLPPHAMVKLAPGGYHLMLLHPLHPVRPGDRVRVTLRFADGRTLDVEFLARPANAGDED